VTAGGFLGIDQLVTEDHLEDAGSRSDESGLETEFGIQVLRQTGGDGFVVSDLAVFDRQEHVRILPRTG